MAEQDKVIPNGKVRNNNRFHLNINNKYAKNNILLFGFILYK